MGDERHSLIVLSGTGGQPVTAEITGNSLDHGQRIRIGLGVWRRDPGSSLEQTGQAGLDPGCRGSGHSDDWPRSADAGNSRLPAQAS